MTFAGGGSYGYFQHKFEPISFFLLCILILFEYMYNFHL